MPKLLKRIIRKLFRKTFIKNFKKECTSIEGRALLYYKTDYYLFEGLLEDRSHTNEWESYEIACVLNRMGYVVDVADRTISKAQVEKIEDKYDIFIGIGAGDSGKYFEDIAKRVPSAKRMLYALGPEPNLSNEITTARHDYFRERHPGKEIVVRRLIKEVDIDASIKHVDAIVTCCNDWGIEGWKRFGKPIHRIWLSSYPALRTTLGEIKQKDPKKFLYFGGNGNITKGLDLAIEAFAKLPHLELYIGAPKGETDFNAVMDPILAASPNIHFVGFMDVKKDPFLSISKGCGYAMLLSSSEASATSVTTCMRRGLVPVVTEASGVDVGSFGFMVQSIRIEDIVAAIERISKTEKDEFVQRSIDSYLESFKYTRAHFSQRFEEIFLSIINTDSR